MGMMSRRKGKKGERATATEIRVALPHWAEQIRRGWQARLGSDAPDVIVPGYWFEVKTGKKPNPRAALEQAITESRERGVPIAVIRDDRKEPFAVLRWKDLLYLIAAVESTKRKERTMSTPTEIVTNLATDLRDKIQDDEDAGYKFGRDVDRIIDAAENAESELEEAVEAKVSKDTMIKVLAEFLDLNTSALMRIETSADPRMTLRREVQWAMKSVLPRSGVETAALEHLVV